MNIAFRYEQEYRNLAQNQTFSEFTGRKLPFAKYSFSLLFPHTSDQIYTSKESEKKLPNHILEIFFIYFNTFFIPK